MNLKRAVKAEVRRHMAASRIRGASPAILSGRESRRASAGQRRTRETKSLRDRAGYAKQDVDKARQGTTSAPQLLGHVRTELEAIAKEQNNQTAAALARDVAGAITSLTSINRTLEKVAIQLRNWS